MKQITYIKGKLGGWPRFELVNSIGKAAAPPFAIFERWVPREHKGEKSPAVGSIYAQPPNSTKAGAATLLVMSAYAKQGQPPSAASMAASVTLFAAGKLRRTSPCPAG